MDINTVLIVGTAVVALVALIVMYQRSKSKVQQVEVDDYNTLEKVLDGVKTFMVQAISEDYAIGMDAREFDRVYKRKAILNDALTRCVYGAEDAKLIVKEQIKSFIVDNVPEDRVAELLGLDEAGEPSSQIKYEIIMYKYKQLYGKKAMVRWMLDNGFLTERLASDAINRHDKAYFVTVEDLNNTYYELDYHLSLDEQRDVLATVVYEMYKGFGIVDTLNEMDIDGYNCGTSGSILRAMSKQEDPSRRANNSVWVYIYGRYIHLRFMNFGTEDELRRIIQLIARYGNPGPLTAKRGYLVNTMENKSRVLALRPPASEYWAVFVRKFTISDNSPEYLIIKKDTVRGDLPVRLLEFLMRGHVTSAFTGRQGSGKTTLMRAVIRYIDPRYTVRILEMAPELYLRETYETRNILSVQQTNTVSSSELQDALKKSDAAVSIVGEVATDEIAARMIQMGMTASIFTIFSHHANTPKDLVLTLRNSLAAASNFSNMQTAEKQVLDVVHIDVHLDYGPDGERYIDRISEIIPLEEGIPYPEYDSTDPNGSLARIMGEYFQRQTDRVSFTTRQLLHFDTATKTYVVDRRMSPFLEGEIKKALEPQLQDEYEYFMLKDWGPRTEEDGNPDIALDVPKRLAELKARIDADGGFYVPAYPGQKEIEPAVPDIESIEEKAAEKAIWAEGYVDGTPDRAFAASIDDSKISEELGFGVGSPMGADSMNESEAEEYASLFFDDEE